MIEMLSERTRGAVRTAVGNVGSRLKPLLWVKRSLTKLHKFTCCFTLTAGLAAASFAQGPQTATPSDSKPLDGITFASMPGHLYIPVKEIGKALNASVTEDEDSGNLMLDGHAVHEVRHMFDGSGIVALSSLREIGANVDWDNSAQLATIQYKDATAEVHQGDKTVIVDKSRQSLMAYQGARLVLATHVSTGREGHGTPNGHFAAGPAKERMHRSKLYNFAPMPWSVQVDGNVFIHGYTSVPNRPASHGCIRMPLTRGNPARYFFNWVDVGTPVTIQGVWSARYASRHGHSRLALRHRRHHHLSRYAARKHRRGRTRWASRHSAKSGQMTASQSHYTLGIARTTPTP